MGDHSRDRPSADQDRHPQKCDENCEAIEDGIGEQPEVSILVGAWYEHQEIQTEDGHNGPEDDADENLEALAGPAEQDANPHRHTHVAHNADPPGHSGHGGNNCQEREPNHKGDAYRQQPPEQDFRDSVLTSTSRRFGHYAAFVRDRSPSIPSLRQRTGRLRITRAESSVHEPLGKEWLLSNMLETI